MIELFGYRRFTMKIYLDPAGPVYAGPVRDCEAVGPAGIGPRYERQAPRPSGKKKGTGKLARAPIPVPPNSEPVRLDGCPHPFVQTKPDGSAPTLSTPN